MKAEPENDAGHSGNSIPISGDVIGDTAYSERFVLKILLKLANRDTLKEEIKEPSFEDELCTLWDMTAERDVVLYLQTHDTLNLFSFALPVIESSRLIEVVIGTIANMCCQKEAVDSLMANKDLLLILLEFLKSDDSQILDQLLRMISSCLYVADEQNIATWMDLFETVEYPRIIYFILQNSSNKVLLMTALENLNTICMNCKIDSVSEKFSSLFETSEALFAVYTAHHEYSDQASLEESLERLHLITLQMMLHLSRTETSNNDQLDKTSVTNGHSNIDFILLRDILTSYESKIEECFNDDTEFLDVLEAATVYIQYLPTETNQSCTPDKYFDPCYSMWKAITHGTQRKTETMQCTEEIKDALALIMCLYLSKCSDNNLLNVLDEIGEDYSSIVSQIKDAELQAKIANKSSNYRNRLDDNIDSR